MQQILVIKKTMSAKKTNVKLFQKNIVKKFIILYNAIKYNVRGGILTWDLLKHLQER